MSEEYIKDILESVKNLAEENKKYKDWLSEARGIIRINELRQPEPRNEAIQWTFDMMNKVFAIYDQYNASTMTQIQLESNSAMLEYAKQFGRNKRYHICEGWMAAIRWIESQNTPK